MLSGCCCNSNKIYPDFEASHDYVKISENKSIHILHLNSNIIENVFNKDSNNENAIETDNQILAYNKKQVTRTDIDLAQISNEPDNTNLNESKTSGNSTNDLNTLIAVYQRQINDFVIENEDNKQSTPINENKFQLNALGKYKDALGFVNENHYKIEFYKIYGERLGYTIIHRKRLKKFPNCNNNEQIRNQPNKINLPMLFLIHGVGGNTFIWQKQLIYFLERGYEIIVPDLLGHGKSTQIKDEKSYQFLSLANDLLVVFDKYAKQKNVVIGHSYGCSFATYLAKKRSSLIEKVIYISGGSPHSLEFKSPLLKFPISLLSVIRPCIDCTFFCSAFSSLSNSFKDSFNVSTSVLQYTMKGQDWPEGNEKYHQTLIQQILIIEGADDGLVPWDDGFDLLLVVYNSYLVILEKGSHMSIYEHHTLINEIMRQFIEEI